MFSKHKRVLSVIRTGPGATAWGMIGRPINLSNVIENISTRKLKQFCYGRTPVFVHPSLYITLKWTYPWDTGGLSQDGSIKMDQGFMGEAVGVLSLIMFKVGFGLVMALWLASLNDRDWSLTRWCSLTIFSVSRRKYIVSKRPIFQLAIVNAF